MKMENSITEGTKEEVNVHIQFAILTHKSSKEVFKWGKKVFKRYKRTTNFKMFYFITFPAVEK